MNRIRVTCILHFLPADNAEDITKRCTTC